MLNINATTTIKAKGYSPAVNIDNGTININAPLKIINSKVANLQSQYVGDSMFEVKNMNINSDLTFDNRSNFVYKVYISSVKMGAKANIRGLGRIFISYASYDSNKTAFTVFSGAMAGFVKKQTVIKHIRFTNHQLIGKHRRQICSLEDVSKKDPGISGVLYCFLH